MMKFFYLQTVKIESIPSHLEDLYRQVLRCVVYLVLIRGSRE